MRANPVKNKPPRLGRLVWLFLFLSHSLGGGDCLLPAIGGQSLPTSVHAGGVPDFLRSSGGVNPPCGEILPLAKCSDGAKAPGRCRALRTAPVKKQPPRFEVTPKS